MSPLPTISHDMALLKSGPVPETYLVPAAELDALLAIQRRYNRLTLFLGETTVETVLNRSHSSVYPTPDPWIMGYSIETEDRGCYTFCRLAEGPDRDAVIDAGLDAWDKVRAERAEQNDGRDW